MRLIATLALVAAVLGIAPAVAGSAEPTYSITYDTCKGHFTPPVIIRAVRDGNCKTWRVTYGTAIRTVGRSSVTGDRPSTSVQLDVLRPLKLFVRVLARPGLRREARWKLECQREEDIRDGGGVFKTSRSTSKSMPFPVENPYSCKVDASATASVRATLRLRVLARFVTHEIAREAVV